MPNNRKILYLYILITIYLLSIPLSDIKAEVVSSANISNNDFTNVALLNPLFERLYRLENGYEGQSKFNIVHIGDSHIQADFFTNTIRQALQSRFGNGGYGFTFPYKLAKTNGASYVNYSSNIEWESRRNIYPITDVSIGLSGIGLYTNNSNFLINVVVNPPYNFNTIKLIYATKESTFTIRETHNTMPPAVTNIPNITYIKHKIKPGETLSSISRKYAVTVESLASTNKLNSDLIQKGDIILIPQKQKKASNIVNNKPSSYIIRNDSSFFSKKSIQPYCSTYTFPELKNKISICSSGKTTSNSVFSLNGIVLENSNPGVIYSSIGVNGAKVSDYLKYPLFFEQLQVLNPDLIIISLGTNESFGKLSAPYFINQMQEFIDKIEVKNPNTLILVMSPPPSLGRKNTSNVFLDSYAKMLYKLNNCVYWNLLEKLGGIEVPRSKSFAQYMAQDKIHYTKDGYEMQGELFLTDFMSAYANYVKNRKNWIQY